MCKSASICFHDAWLTSHTSHTSSAVTLTLHNPGCAGDGENGDSPALLLHQATVLGSERAPGAALDR